MNPTDFLLNRKLYNRFYDEALSSLPETHQLSRIELDILLFFYNNPAFDKAKDVVEVRGIAKSYVSKAVDQLVQKGLLEVTLDRVDRRISHLTLSEKAFPIVQQGREIQAKAIETMVAGITEEELCIVQRVMKKITENMRKEIEE